MQLDSTTERPCNIGIANGQCIYVNEIVYSCKACFKMILQNDGNLVIYTANDQAIWDAGTRGKGGVQLCMQGDGNLVLYTAAFNPVWSTGTFFSGAFAELQPDGQLAIWQSGIARYVSGKTADCIPRITTPNRKLNLSPKVKFN